MPELFSVTVAMTAALAAYRSGARGSHAMSPEGQFARSQVTLVLDRLDEPYSLQVPHADLLAELEELVLEHSLPGWDGNEAPPVAYATHEYARQFIRALPSDVPPPELAVDPDDASVSFEWSGGYRKVFSVSVGETGRLAFSGLRGTDRWHGALAFKDQVPALVLDSIRQILA